MHLYLIAFSFAANGCAYVFRRTAAALGCSLPPLSRLLEKKKKKCIVVHWFYREYILEKNHFKVVNNFWWKRIGDGSNSCSSEVVFFFVCVKRALRQVYELVLEPWHCVYGCPPGLEIATRPPSKYCWKLIPPINAITFLVNLAAGVIIMLDIFRLCNLKIVLWQQKRHRSHSLLCQLNVKISACVQT